MNQPCLGRVLCVTSNFPRWKGDSTTPFVLNLAQDLQKLGWQVDILAPHAPHALKDELINGVSVKRFQYCWPESKQTVCYNGGALINLRKKRTNFLKLLPLVLLQWFSVLRCLSSGNYDLIHSHWILPQGFTGAVASMITGVPQIITVHGGDIFGLRGPVMGQFKRLALKGADAITVNSSVTYDAVRECAPPDGKAYKIPMGVSCVPSGENSPAVCSIRRCYRNEGGVLLLFVGRVIEEKGIEDIIHSVGLISMSSSMKVSALIVGEGQERPRFERLVQTLGLEKKIFFTGWVAQEEVSDYLAAADIFVGPSKKAPDGWIEAQGLTFIEAMISKTPVIATKSGGIQDYLIHDETGLLVDENSPGQIADAVLRLSNDKILREKIANKGYQVALRKYSREVSAASFSKLFSETLGSKACG